MNDSTFTLPHEPSFELPLSGRVRQAQLRMPALDEMLLLWFPPSTQTAARMAVFFPAEIERVLDTLDGQSVDLPIARSVYAEPAAFAAYLEVRNRLLESGNDSGMVFAQCPHCRQWEADLSPLALAVGLHSAFWPTVDANQCLAVPALASDLTRPSRASSDALTSRLRFELPSARGRPESPFREGVLATHDVDAREKTFEGRLDALRVMDVDQYGDWDSAFAGVRALVRLCAVVAQIDGDPDKVSPEYLAMLPLADFIFVDNVHYLTHHVSLPDDSPLRLRCANCAGRFVPVQ